MPYPIHICHVITDGNIGGAGVLLANLIENLDSEKIRTSVILPKNSLLCPRLSNLDTNLIEAEITPDSSIDIGGIFILRKLLSNLRPDIVHTHGSATARLCAKTLGITTVNTRHCDTKMKTFLYNSITNFTVATSENMLSSMPEIPIENRIFIPNGATSPHVLNANQRLQLKTSLGIPENAIVIGSVGRLESIKGFDIFLSAAARLKEKLPLCRFLIVGDGSLRESLFKLSRSLSLSEEVIFCGHRENAGDFMNIFDVGVLASRGSETTPLALSEMMSLSLPCVVSDIAGHTYMVRDGAGALFKNGSASSLASVLFSLCLNRELRNTLGNNAKIRYESEFTPRQMSRRYENMYEAIAKRFPPK